MAAKSNTIQIKPKPSPSPSPPPPLKDDPPTKKIDAQKLIKSVDELNSLATVLNEFHCRYNELQKHIEFIQSAIENLDPETSIVETDTEVLPQISPPAHVLPVVSAPNANDETSTLSELEGFCQNMCGRGLRRYIVGNLSSDGAKLRAEVSAALKYAPDPARLVLDCVGRFYLQGAKAYSKNSPMNQGRASAVLVLEFFLLAGCGGGNESGMERAVKEEADLASTAWRKRLINEGGISKTNDVDARGLLLFIASFGIPDVFRIEEIRDLIRLSYPVEISDALRRSSCLLVKIPELIEGEMKKGMKAAAVDIALTFGLEEKFPPREILTSFLQESKETWKKIRKESKGTIHVQKEASRKHLAALKSVKRCLEDHKIDPSKFLPDCEIKEQTINLQKDIEDLDKKISEEKTKIFEEKTYKRKLDELEASRSSKLQVEKRTRNTTTYASSSMTPINSFSNGASYASTSLPDSIFANRVGSSLSTVPSGVLSTSAFPSGLQRDILVDRVGPYSTSNYTAYEWPRAMAGDMVAGQNYTRHPSMIGDSLIEQSYARHPSLIGNNSNNLYGPSHTLEGFAGMPSVQSISAVKRNAGSDLYQSVQSISAVNRGASSDLYQFADTVLEGESYYGRGSHQSGTPNPVIPRTHYSSYPF